MIQTADNPNSMQERGTAFYTLLYSLLSLALVSGFAVFFEPAIYDLLLPLGACIWLFSPFKIYARTLPILGLLILYVVFLWLSYLPYIGEDWYMIGAGTSKDAGRYCLIDAYLYLTAIFYILFFSQDAPFRFELCARAFIISAILSAIIGLLGYLGFGGLSEYTLMYGTRIKGLFKDTNLFGPYLIFSIVYLINDFFLSKVRPKLWKILIFTLLIAGLFLSFSRGAWGACFVAVSMMLMFVYKTSSSQKEKNRMIKLTFLIIIFFTLTVFLLLLDESTRNMLALRFSLVQEYDVGEGGRFTSQVRALSLFIDSPNGLGPLRYFFFFGVDPHSSYISAFSNRGWLGGLTWIMIVALTCWMGFRLCLRPSPYRHLAQICFPALFSIFLQAFQIDIDHWRHFHLLLGMVWGLEIARVEWQKRQIPMAATPEDRPPLSAQNPVPAS